MNHRQKKLNQLRNQLNDLITYHEGMIRIHERFGWSRAQRVCDHSRSCLSILKDRRSKFLYASYIKSEKTILKNHGYQQHQKSY
jgi:hypothetical protein